MKINAIFYVNFPPFKKYFNKFARNETILCEHNQTDKLRVVRKYAI